MAVDKEQFMLITNILQDMALEEEVGWSTCQGDIMSELFKCALRGSAIERHLEVTAGPKIWWPNC